MSPGCANCYAETLSKRNPAVLGQWGRGKPRVLAKNWNEPVKWNKAWNKAQYFTRVQGQPEPAKPTVFPSLCDWLDDEVPVEWLARFLKLIHDTPNLTWLLLTKRPELWRQRLELVTEHLDETDIEASKTGGLYVLLRNWLGTMGGPSSFRPPNVWVGTSVEDQIRAGQRIPALLKIPAVGRFLSVEPLLGPVDLERPMPGPDLGDEGSKICQPWFIQSGIDWVIIGGESGTGARPCNIDWIRSLVGQCKAAGVPAFVKQLGARAYEDDFAHTKECWNEQCALAGGPDDCNGEVIYDSLELGHPKGGDPAEWPEDLRVREFPEGLR